MPEKCGEVSEVERIKAVIELLNRALEESHEYLAMLEEAALPEERPTIADRTASQFPS